MLTAGAGGVTAVVAVSSPAPATGPNGARGRDCDGLGIEDIGSTAADGGGLARFRLDAIAKTIVRGRAADGQQFFDAVRDQIGACRVERFGRHAPLECVETAGDRR